jgi:sugar phosphate isomerase/epimerase
VTPKGSTKQPANLARVIRILREANYRGYVALEYEAAEDPKTAVPRHLAELRKLIS